MKSKTVTAPTRKTKGSGITARPRPAPHAAHIGNERYARHQKHNKAIITAEKQHGMKGHEGEG